MTDLSLAEFFGVAPCPGVESQFYDGRHVTSGFGGYLNDADAPWAVAVDYRLATIDHLFTYFWPNGWFGRELRSIQKKFLASSKSVFVGYCVGPSALGALEGRDGHQAGLERVDRLCQQMMMDTHGRLRITLMSDHGHRFGPTKHVELRDRLRALGYHTSEKLKQPSDVVAIEFGLVSCAALYTQQPEAVARDCVSIDGIELAAWLDEQKDEVVVISRTGLARVARTPTGFSYTCERGDPLNYAPGSGRSKAFVLTNGPLTAEQWFQETKLKKFPDAPARLWRAFHGLVRHRADVLLSVEDGYYCGSDTMDSLYTAIGIHGSLNLTSSSGFCMTTAGELPDAIRMAELRQKLCILGVRLEERGKPLDVAAHPPTASAPETAAR